MMDDSQTADALGRLSKIEGQIKGIRKMVESRRYCVDILNQTRAVSAAINKVEEMIMRQHLETCVTDSLSGNDDMDKREKITEIMDVFSRLRK